MGTIKEYLVRNYRHFNAAALMDAAKAWHDHLLAGGKMMLTMGGAMSTGEIGICLAELIRRDKVHALTVTGANLEEDVFNLVAHEHYVRVPNYRELRAEDEVALLQRGLNRVTDTCIPEEEAMRRIERKVIRHWKAADQAKTRFFPHEYLYQVIDAGELESELQIDPKNSWLLAAAKKRLPIWVPGWEDSTLGNMYVALVTKGELSGYQLVKSGLEQMGALVDWYLEQQAKASIGFFQIGGGITGDFPICVVPLIEQDLRQKCKKWGYFCQISEAKVSYGSYSGAPPNEKITWGKLDATTPRFIIESDASIVFPLIAAYLLDL
jgi:deoxyhypusine synthase